MDPRPGPRPITGDRVDVTADDTMLTITGPASVSGVVSGGQGYAQLLLSAADPADRRTLSAAKRLQFYLYRGEYLAYESPMLTVERVWRVEDTEGGVAVLGRP